MLNRIKSEPALVVGALASVLVALAGEAGIVLDEASLRDVLTPIVVSVVTRHFVSPAR